jgi:hypothetical protein
VRIDLAQTATPIWVSVIENKASFSAAITDRAFDSLSKDASVSDQINDDALTVIMKDYSTSDVGSILDEDLAPHDGFATDDSLVPQLAGASLASYCAAAALVLSYPRDEWIATERQINVLNWLPKKKKSKLVE